MFKTAGIYAARSDIEPRTHPRRGLVSRITPGSDPGRVLQRAGLLLGGRTPRICDLYEIPGADLFTTQGYRDVAAKDTEGTAVIALLTSRSNTIYDPMLTVNVPPVDTAWADGRASRVASRPRPCPRPGSICPTGTRPRSSSGTGRGSSPASGPGGIPRGPALRQGPPHPVAASRDPRWFVINEWEGVMAAMADGTAKEALGPARRRAGRPPEPLHLQRGSPALRAGAESF